MNLSKIMGSMTLRERRMLNEAVKQRIVEEESDAVAQLKSVYDAATASYDLSRTRTDWDLATRAYDAWVAADKAANSASTDATSARTSAVAAPVPATAPSDASLIGSTLSKDGKVVFELTEEGWKTTLRISEEQILALVIPAVKERIKNQMRAGSGQGDELVIVIGSLLNPGTANRSNGLFLKRDGKEFADPVAITAEKMKTIMDNQKLVYANGKDPNRQDTLAATRAGYTEDATAIGAAFIGFKADGITELLVPSDKLSGFDDLFGTSNSGKISLAIKKVADSKADAAQKDAGKNPNEKYPESFKIPLSWAMDRSIMKYMSDSILRGVGIGKIEFKLTSDNAAEGASGTVPFYTASVKLNEKEISALRAKLGARSAANAAT